MKNANPYMSHFQLAQAQLVPAADFLSWNVKCHPLSSGPPASCSPGSTLPPGLADRGVWQGVLVCNTVMHFANTTGSVSETTGAKMGSSKCRLSSVENTVLEKYRTCIKRISCPEEHKSVGP